MAARPLRLRRLQERPHAARGLVRREQPDARRLEQGDRPRIDAVVAGELEGDEPAVGMADDVGPLDAQAGEQPGAQRGVVLDAPRPARGYRPAIAKHSAVQRAGERGVPADERPRMREHHRLTVAEQLVLDPDAIELDGLHGGIQVLLGQRPGKTGMERRSGGLCGAGSSWARAAIATGSPPSRRKNVTRPAPAIGPVAPLDDLPQERLGSLTDRPAPGGRRPEPTRANAANQPAPARSAVSIASVSAASARGRSPASAAVRPTWVSANEM